MTKILLTVALALTACAVQTDTSTEEQSLCTLYDQQHNQCPGQTSCTPLDSCTDANFQNGTCCVHFRYPAQPTTVGAVNCGTDPTNNDQPICIRTNHYDFGLVQISCTTVTRWYTDANGEVFSQQETECVYG
jgi:hypothetical protein